MNLSLCQEAIYLRSDLTIEEVDTKALGIYIAFAILYQDRREELEALDLRVHPRARKILITTTTTPLTRRR